MNPIGLIFVTLILGDDYTETPAQLLNSTNHTISDNLKFIFYPPGQTVNVTYPYNYSLAIYNHPAYDPSKKTIFYHHGLNENCTQLKKDQSCYRIVTGFQKYALVNLILIDYANLVAKDELTASVNTENMGPLLCNFYTNFFKQCNCENNTDIIGYSLGSQSVHTTFKNCSTKPNSVVSLDAANLPYFQKDHINKKDANFLQAIHTSGGIFGMNKSYGTADFFPNGGQRQTSICYPGSELMILMNNDPKLCSHYSSIIYYMNTVRYKYMYPSNKCNKRNNKTQYFMGYALEKSACGNFCLNISYIPRLE